MGSFARRASWLLRSLDNVSGRSAFSQAQRVMPPSCENLLEAIPSAERQVNHHLLLAR
jgi:hypothetical protein